MMNSQDFRLLVAHTSKQRSVRSKVCLATKAESVQNVAAEKTANILARATGIIFRSLSEVQIAMVGRRTWLLSMNRCPSFRLLLQVHANAPQIISLDVST